MLQLLFRNVENNDDKQINEGCLRFIPTFEVCCLQGEKMRMCAGSLLKLQRPSNRLLTHVESNMFFELERDAFKVKPLLAERVGAVWSLNGEVAFLHLKRFTCASETRGP